MADATANEGIRNVVLVHGAWVDGSGWEGVFHALGQAGYDVRVVQNPTASLADDVAATRQVVASMDGPVLLVGHSYGGAVITEAGHDPQVAGLVYIAGWVPDAGESVGTLLTTPWPGARPDSPAPPIVPRQDGFLLLDRAKFHAAFAADIAAEKGAFLANAQVPWGDAALNGRITEAAWRSKPGWYLLATEDRMIPPEWQRAMARRAGLPVTEVAASHAAFLSQPQEVVALIQRVAERIGRAAANAEPTATAGAR